MMHRFLVYDIETIPESEVSAEWTDRTTKDGEEKFPPLWAHRVATIGTLTLDATLRAVQSGVCAAGAVAGDERAMIQRWSDLASGHVGRSQALTLVDFNGRMFDVPVLQHRAFRFGIQLPWLFAKLPDGRGQVSSWSKPYRDRYAGQHVDVCDLFSNHGACKPTALTHLARLMGLPGKEAMNGGEVYAAWKEGRKNEIDRYCMEDVYQTALVLIRFQFVTGQLTRDHYLGAVTSVLEHVRAKAPEHDAFLSEFDLQRLELAD